MKTTTTTKNTTSVNEMVHNAIHNHNDRISGSSLVINWNSGLGLEITYTMEKFCELGVFDNKTQTEINHILWYLANVGREGMRSGQKAFCLGNLTK